MKNWKTTLGGALGAAAPVVKAMLPDQWSWVGDAMLSFGLLLLGKSAVDATKAAGK